MLKQLGVCVDYSSCVNADTMRILVTRWKATERMDMMQLFKTFVPLGLGTKTLLSPRQHPHCGVPDPLTQYSRRESL